MKNISTPLIRRKLQKIIMSTAGILGTELKLKYKVQTINLIPVEN